MTGIGQGRSASSYPRGHISRPSLTHSSSGFDNGPGDTETSFRPIPPAKDTPKARVSIPESKPRSWGLGHSRVKEKGYSPVHDFQPVSWPKAPRPLHRALTAKRMLTILWDSVITSTPITFIVIAFCALSLDGTPASNFGHNILEAEKLGPTVFPVVYAAIVGRLMTTLARWRAEKGSKLGLIEQLNGSQSLFTALERAFLLRRWNVVAISIIILWGLSPLGGQSALRILDVKPSTYPGTASLRYLNTNLTFTNDIAGAANFGPVSSQVQVLLKGSLLASPTVRLSPLDAWGNVKIPLIQSLPGFNSNDPDNPWLEISDVNESQLEYSSLTGITVVGLPTDSSVVTSNFRVESSYSTFDCPEVHQISTSNINDDILSLLYDQIGPLAVHTNSTQISEPVGVPMTTNTLLPDWIVDFHQGVNIEPSPNIIYAKLHEPIGREDQLGAAWSNCSMETSHVESNVTCEGSKCAVSHMRLSLADPRPPSISAFDDLGAIKTLLGAFPYLGLISGDSEYNRDLLTTYLTDADAVILQKQAQEFNIAGSTSHAPAIATIAPPVFSTRLTQLWNSYLQLVWASSYVSGGAPLNLSAYGNQTRPWTAGMDANTDTSLTGDPPLPNNVSTAYVVRNGTPVYATDRAWTVFLLVLSFLLQCCAILTTILKYSCRIPHVLGHVSSLTRDNPHVRLPPGGTTLDGLERARLLKDMYVQLGDVREEEAVGHIALKSGVTQGIDADKERVYF